MREPPADAGGSRSVRYHCCSGRFILRVGAVDRCTDRLRLRCQRIPLNQDSSRRAEITEDLTAVAETFNRRGR